MCIHTDESVFLNFDYFIYTSTVQLVFNILLCLKNIKSIYIEYSINHFGWPKIRNSPLFTVLTINTRYSMVFFAFIQNLISLFTD